MTSRVVRDLPQSSAEALLAELRRRCEILAQAPGEDVLDREFREAHDGIAAILSSPAARAHRAALQGHPGTAELAEKLSAANAAYHRCAELAKARRAMAQGAIAADPFEDSWLSPGFEQLLRGQVERWQRHGLLDRARARPIVVVGGGALPQSQVLLHRATGRTVISIEEDAESAAVARELLAAMGCPRDLIVVEADGSEYDFSGALLVVVATLVAKKALIAAQVARTAPRAFLNVRTPTGLHRLWRVPMEAEQLSRWNWSTIDRWTPRAASVCALTCRQQA